MVPFDIEKKKKMSLPKCSCSDMISSDIQYSDWTGYSNNSFDTGERSFNWTKNKCNGSYSLCKQIYVSHSIAQQISLAEETVENHSIHQFLFAMNFKIICEKISHGEEKDTKQTYTNILYCIDELIENRMDHALSSINIEWVRILSINFDARLQKSNSIEMVLGLSWMYSNWSQSDYVNWWACYS